MIEAVPAKDLFIWSSRFETGIREVDQQHARLVQIINRLARLNGEAGSRPYLELLDELADYCRYHFHTEESLMAQYALDPEFVAAHVQAHRSLTEQIRIVHGVTEGAADQASLAVSRLLPFLTKWLIFHVLGTDMRMAHEIHALQQGVAPEQARQQAVDSQGETLLIVLDALNELADSLANRTAELQAANLDLQMSEARYALAQRAARIGNWELNLATREVHCTAQAEALLGLEGSGAILHLDDFLPRVHVEDRARVLAALAKVEAEGGGYEQEHRVLWPDGSVHWLNLVGECVVGNDAMRLIGIVRDTTAERTAQQQLQEINQQLNFALNSLGRHATDLTRINELNESLQSCLAAAEAFEVVERVLDRLGLGQGGALAVPADGGAQLRTVAIWGVDPGSAPQYPVTQCWAMRSGQRYAVRHPEDGPHCQHFERTPRPVASICLPLRVLGETLGLLSVSVDADTGDAEWARINHLASMVAESLKLALSNIQLREALRDQATRDPLTGLLNRRYLDEALPRELMRARRDSRPLSLVMLDLDHFKRVNDSWGHEAGDAVLVQLAVTLRAQLRGSDLACRYGGEEFVVVMPGATLADAHERIEAVSRRVHETFIQTPHGTISPVSFSAGIAEAFVHGNSTEELLRQADLALYAAKEAGRDCVRDASQLDPAT